MTIDESCVCSPIQSGKNLPIGLLLGFGINDVILCGGTRAYSPYRQRNNKKNVLISSDNYFMLQIFYFQKSTI